MRIIGAVPGETTGIAVIDVEVGEEPTIAFVVNLAFKAAICYLKSLLLHQACHLVMEDGGAAQVTEAMTYFLALDEAFTKLPAPKGWPIERLEARFPQYMIGTLCRGHGLDALRVALAYVEEAGLLQGEA